jgi:hypothetical protein
MRFFSNKQIGEFANRPGGWYNKGTAEIQKKLTAETPSPARDNSGKPKPRRFFVMSTFLEAIEAEVTNRVSAQIDEAVAAATAKIQSVGSRTPRVLTFPEGVEQISLSELLTYNGVVMDLQNMTVVQTGQEGNKSLDGRSIVTPGASILAGAVEPNG